jgi:urease accessory protein
MTRRYRAHAAVTAECDAHGRTRLTRLRSDGPLALRDTGEAVHIVGAAAGPLGGDELTLDVTVGPGARLAVRSVATTLLLPGDGESCFTVRAEVAPGGHLDFAPEPAVAAHGCHHRAVARVELAAGATLRWSEELILGRHREQPGRHTSRFDVTVGGVPLLRHELCLDEPAVYETGAVLGADKAVGSLLLVDPELTRRPHIGDGLAVMPLAGPGVLVTATAGNSAVLRERLTGGERLAQVATTVSAMAR